MTRILIASFLLCAATAAAAATWTPVDIATNGTIWFVDQESVKDVSDSPYGAARKAWIKLDYSKVKSEVAREAKVLFMFKCDIEQARFISWVSYKADGGVLTSNSSTYNSYQPVVPESVLSSAMKKVCS